MSALPEPIPGAVAVCEEHAEELFDGDEYFTSLTKWQDGDFRVEVRHGKTHEREPYRQRLEVVTYRHGDGAVVYADKTRFIDRHRTETHEQEVLERRGGGGLR